MIHFPYPCSPCPKGLPTKYTPQRSAHGTPKTPPDTDRPRRGPQCRATEPSTHQQALTHPLVHSPICLSAKGPVHESTFPTVARQSARSAGWPRSQATSPRNKHKVRYLSVPSRVQSCSCSHMCSLRDPTVAGRARSLARLSARNQVKTAPKK